MVGMEVHVELATRSKMWTSAPNVAHPDFFDAEPNSLLDPVVIGMPGVLPVMNRQALDMAMLVGLALECKICRRTKWDRKSYYYPDLPKNYQISQYDRPLCEEGLIEIPISDESDAKTKTVRIIRAHLEEDAGKLLHEAPGGVPIDHSIVDLNRAGTPLLEIVTYPDLESPQECVQFGQALRSICRHLGVSSGILQMGHMRFEPNINVIIEQEDSGQTFATPIVEIKNLNSFKALHGAVAYEHARQLEQWQQTGQVMGQRAKTTRGWDDAQGVTTPQRHKEDADEYRYFPDPDLVVVEIDEPWIERIRSSLPELPQLRQRRYVQEFKLNIKDARALLDEPMVCEYFEQVLAEGVEPRRAAAMLLNSGAKRANERGIRIDQLGISPGQVGQILELTSTDRISSTAADELFGLACESDVSLEQLAEQHNLLQVSDTDALEGFVARALADSDNAQIVADISDGKDRAIGALVGKIMKVSKGQANPKLVRQIIQKKLDVG